MTYKIEKLNKYQQSFGTLLSSVQSSTNRRINIEIKKIKKIKKKLQAIKDI